MQSSRSSLALFTGIVLILAPLIAWAFKLMSFGWMIVLLIFTGLILLLVLGYVLQVIIAVQGFLKKADLFGAARKRATLAAWVTSISVMLLAIVLPDGGDSSIGSTLQRWLGSYGDNGYEVYQTTQTVNDVLFVVLLVVFVGSYLWLAIEWIRALRRRADLRKSAAAQQLSTTQAPS